MNDQESGIFSEFKILQDFCMQNRPVLLPSSQCSELLVFPQPTTEISRRESSAA